MPIRSIRHLAIVTLAAVSAACNATATTAAPQEDEAPKSPRVTTPLAPIPWMHDKAGAEEAVARTRRPLLALAHPEANPAPPLFAHPIVADVVEHLFVPYRAPAPKARLTATSPGGSSMTLTPPFTLPRFTDFAVRALRAAKRPVPPYLDLLHREADTRARGVEVAIFGMS